MTWTTATAVGLVVMVASDGNRLAVNPAIVGNCCWVNGTEYRRLQFDQSLPLSVRPIPQAVLDWAMGVAV
jgi:hypothetical protein